VLADVAGEHSFSLPKPFTSILKPAHHPSQVRLSANAAADDIDRACAAFAPVKRSQEPVLLLFSGGQVALTDTPPPSPRTKSTRRVPHPVLIGHAASLSQVALTDTQPAGPAGMGAVLVTFRAPDARALPHRLANHSPLRLGFQQLDARAGMVLSVCPGEARAPPLRRRPTRARPAHKGPRGLCRAEAGARR
jgi:hypothetical protein